MPSLPSALTIVQGGCCALGTGPETVIGLADCLEIGINLVVRL